VDERLKGKPFKVSMLTGASTGPELDQVMGLTEAISFRFPYNGDAVLREKFNAGVIEYQDMHLSHAGSLVRYGYYGRPDNKIDFAVIEVTKIREDGSVVFSSSIGANTAYLEVADKIILEVSEWQDERLEGMHDVVSVPGKHGDRVPIPVLKTDDRVGSPYYKIDVSRVAAVVVSPTGSQRALRRPRPTTSGSPSTSSTSRRRGEGRLPKASRRCSRASATSRTPCSSA
jgi:succinyl-CoA:acetate CoA-transferase